MSAQVELFAIDEVHVGFPSAPGFVPTPELVVDVMVDKLFDGKLPSRHSRILDPGCGPGAFVEGIIRWCERHQVEVPAITGVELDPCRHAEAAARFRAFRSITIVKEDFLARPREPFDFVIGNPPYVPITSFSENEKAGFRAKYATARGRFDLYLLFFEQALRFLKPRGRLVFITPEKFLYVKTAEPLRRMLGELAVREVLLVDEETFGSLVTYPTITTVDNAPSGDQTIAILRDGTARPILFPSDGSSLLPLLNGHVATSAAPTMTLEHICVRVSCGVATGADKEFVHDTASLPDRLARFAFPTISGRELVPGKEYLQTRHSMLIPYDHDGNLLDVEELGALRDFLALPARRQRLSARTCVKRKPWYAFHDSVPLEEILRPKLLCKDITATPSFWVDRDGGVVPRHSSYYIVPRDPATLDELASYLNSPDALSWMRAHCQRVANGYLRLQSAILKRLPVPESFAPAARVADVAEAVVRRAAARRDRADLVLSRHSRAARGRDVVLARHERHEN